jgi:hypothetical protein
VLLCIARDPGLRLRDLAAGLGITERSAHAIVADLAQAGYVIKQKDGRRNRYQIEAHLPLPEPGTREPAISEVLALLWETRTALPGRRALLPRPSSGRRSCRPADDRPAGFTSDERGRPGCWQAGGFWPPADPGSGQSCYDGPGG